MNNVEENKRENKLISFMFPIERKTKSEKYIGMPKSLLLFVVICVLALSAMSVIVLQKNLTYNRDDVIVEKQTENIITSITVSHSNIFNVDGQMRTKWIQVSRDNNGKNILESYHMNDIHSMVDKG